MVARLFDQPRAAGAGHLFLSGASSSVAPAGGGGLGTLSLRGNLGGVGPGVSAAQGIVQLSGRIASNSGVSANLSVAIPAPRLLTLTPHKAVAVVIALLLCLAGGLTHLSTWAASIVVVVVTWVSESR